MIRFGWLSAILLLGAAQGLIVATLLMTSRRDRIANRVLAVLITVFAARLVPFIIGYAGFYDAYPWLSFAPFAITLVYGPLIYTYVTAVTRRAFLSKTWLHFLPGLVQLAYYLIVFVHPLAFKNDWDLRFHEKYVVPIETFATFTSLISYLTLSMIRYRSYRASLRESTADPDEAHLRWLFGFLVAFTITVVLNLAWAIWDELIYRLNYFEYFPLYLWFTALVYYLGLEGYRHAGDARPQPAISRSAAHEAGGDVREEAQRWLATLRASGHFRDPLLTLPLLAERLNVSAARITRLVNDGLGQNFSDTINRLRLEEVCRALDDPSDSRDLLEIASDAGFNSKASFNRAFKAIVGMTPSDYRRRAVVTSQLPIES